MIQSDMDNSASTYDKGTSVDGETYVLGTYNHGVVKKVIYM